MYYQGCRFMEFLWDYGRDLRFKLWQHVERDIGCNNDVSVIY